MNINYCITVNDEEDEFIRLVTTLLQHKKDTDNIFVLQDSSPTGVNTIHKQSIAEYCTENKNIQYITKALNGDFATFKNEFYQWIQEGDYIFQLDADEMIDPFLIGNIHALLEANPVDLVHLARVNTVKGLTPEHIAKWGWRVNEKGWLNFPDYQGRIYKSSGKIAWRGKVHEKIMGHSTEVYFPAMEGDNPYAIIHPKTIVKQEKQNSMYEKL